MIISIGDNDNYGMLVMKENEKLNKIIIISC